MLSKRLKTILENDIVILAPKPATLEKFNLEKVDDFNSTSIFENYDSNNLDVNYTSSVFMVLALVKELMNLGNSEEDAFRMIFKEFMLTGAKNSNWEYFFYDTFGFSVEDFYNNLQSYTLNLEDIVPSTLLSLNQIFN